VNSVKKYSTYFKRPHINLISLVQFLVIGAMLISQKIFYSLEFVFFKLEKMIVQTLKYLKCDVQHKREICWNQDSAVGIATGYRLKDRRVRVHVLVGSRIFSSACCAYRF
jgi:hypothetical protein